MTWQAEYIKDTSTGSRAAARAPLSPRAWGDHSEANWSCTASVSPLQLTARHSCLLAASPHEQDARTDASVSLSPSAPCQHLSSSWSQGQVTGTASHSPGPTPGTLAAHWRVLFVPYFQWACLKPTQQIQLSLPFKSFISVERSTLRKG